MSSSSDRHARGLPDDTNTPRATVLSTPAPVADHVLLLDDDPAVVRTVKRHLGDNVALSVATSEQNAIALLALRKDWATFLLDLSVDGDVQCGLRVLREVRRRFPAKPAALMTGGRDPDLLNEATALGAHILWKPVDRVHLLGFVQRTTGGAARRTLVAALEREPLTPREREVVLSRFDGVSIAEFSARAGITPSTVKTHINNLLTKTGDASVTALIARVQREA